MYTTRGRGRRVCLQLSRRTPMERSSDPSTVGPSVGDECGLPPLATSRPFVGHVSVSTERIPDGIRGVPHRAHASCVTGGPSTVAVLILGCRARVVSLAERSG